MSLQLELSVEADKDLESIFDYTFEVYGLDQAMKYLSSFDDTFETLIKYPNIGRDRSELLQGMRGAIHDSFIIFYSVEPPDCLRIERILHSSRDFFTVF